MKNTRRIASLLLALVMVIAMAAPVFAADGDEATAYTITIKNETSGYTYVAYQIFAGTLSADGTTLSNVSWGENVDEKKLADAFAGTQFADMTKVEDVMAKLNGVENDAALAQEFAEAISKALKGEGTSSGTTSNSYTISDLEAGYYLVVNTSVPSTDASYTRYILQVVDNVTVNHKGTVPSVDKVILEEDGDDEDSNPDEVKENEASIGDTITYQITGTLPSNIADYDTYYYVFTDTLSKGLTYTNKLKVTVNGVDVTKYFYVNAPKADEQDNYADPTADTTITVGIQDLLVLDNDIDETQEGVQYLQDANGNVMTAITAGTEIVITYTAVLNENAKVGTTGNENKVDLTYSNDPNNDGDGTTTPPPTNPPAPTTNKPTGKTPESKVYTYTTDLKVIKVDQDGNVLTGAEFTIEGTSVNTVVVKSGKFVEDTAGTYYKLNDGTYTTTAPKTDDPTTDDVNEDTTDAYESTTVKYKLIEETETIVETTDVKVSAFVGADGTVTFTGLGAGEYTITETVTPDGYNTVDPIKVTITWSPDGTDCTWTYGGTDYEDANGNKQYDQGETYLAQVTVVNQAGSVLPETGGMGTTLFYIVGGLLVAAAVVLLVTKRRMGAAE